MDVPTFSIIIPTLNEEKFLPKLLDSLMHQTFKDFEVIVSDGNSKDQTAAIARTYKNVKVIENNFSHLAKQRNSGARIARGKWLVFIDADGLLVPHALERMKFYIDTHACEHFTPWFTVDIGAEVASPKKVSLIDYALVCIINLAQEIARLIHRPVATGQCSVMTKAAFDAVGGYNERLSWGEDNDISRRIVEKGFTFGIVRKPLVVYSLRRFHKEGVIHTLWYSVKAGISFVLTKKTPSAIIGYRMGGQEYD